MKVEHWTITISDIAHGIHTFIEETDYPIKYNAENTSRTLWSMYNDPDTALLCDYSEDVFNGFSIIQKTNEFHNEYFGYLSKFYIMPSRRKSRAVFRLMQEAVDWFDENNCVQSFATATAGVGKDESFIKLLRKFGYVQTTTGMLIRKQYGKI